MASPTASRLPARLRSPTAALVAVALVAVIVAYHYSLTTLARNLGVDTPLAYLGLVPLVALMLAVNRSKPQRGELEVHDRQFDYVVGVPLLLGALLVLMILPRNLSTLFWVWRLDLLTLPMFVAGTVSITFGVRALWRIRVAICFLLLAWPLPYQWSLDRVLDGMTALTLAGIRFAIRHVPVADTIPGQPSFFSIEHSGDTFPVNVASACAGVNGVIGFVLLGLAFGVVVRGGRVRKALWLAGGIALLWALNVVRILAVFATGHRWGESTAIDTFHPYVGLVTFNIGALLMVLVMRLFGLRFGRPGPATVPYAEAARVLRRAVPRFRLAAGLILAVTTVIAAANAQLRDYELVADELGAPRLQSFLTSPPAPDGWSIREVDSYAWARQYFGRDSTWIRFRYSPASPPSAAAPTALGARFDKSTTKAASLIQSRAQSIRPDPAAAAPAAGRRSFYADVITTSNLRSFSTFGIAQCYRFHGYRLDREKEVDFGGGITGLLVEYHNTRLDSDWTSASWVWPVRTPAGTRFERVTLMSRVLTTAGSESVGAAGGEGGEAEEVLALARQVVAEQASVSETAGEGPAAADGLRSTSPPASATARPGPAARTAKSPEPGRAPLPEKGVGTVKGTLLKQIGPRTPGPAAPPTTSRPLLAVKQ